MPVPRRREEAFHATVTQEVEVIDAVRAGEHPADHRRRFRDRVRRAQAQPLLEEIVQAGGLSQSHRWDQASGRHQVRVIENGSDRVRGFHLRGVPCLSRNRVCGNSDSPAQQGHSRPTPRSTTHPHRWIRAQGQGSPARSNSCWRRGRRRWVSRRSAIRMSTWPAASFPAASLRILASRLAATR